MKGAAVKEKNVKSARGKVLASAGERADGASLPSVAVIGHRGRMGGMLARRWRAAGFRVSGADRAPDAAKAGETPPARETSAGGRAAEEGGIARGVPHEGTDRAGPHEAAERVTPHEGTERGIPRDALVRAVQGARAVVLCVPAPALEPLLALLGPLLSPRQVLLDITSVKMTPMLLMERFHHGPVVGAHPLFGPSPASGDLPVALTPGARAEEEHTALAETLFRAIGCRTFRTGAEEHDRAVAFVQGLNFVASAAYFASLAHREDILPFLTPSFRRRLEGARKLLTEDAPMFQGFTSANPMTRDALHTYRLFLDLAESGGLPEVVRRASWWYEREE